MWVVRYAGKSKKFTMVNISLRIKVILFSYRIVTYRIPLVGANMGRFSRCRNSANSFTQTSIVVYKHIKLQSPVYLNEHRKLHQNPSSKIS